MKHLLFLYMLNCSLFAQINLNEHMNWQDKIFPNIQFTGVDGTSQTLSDIDADILLIDFWYLACRPCLKSFPSIQSLWENYSDKNIVILALNPLDEIADVKQFQSDFNYTFEFGIISKIVFFDELKMDVMPRTMILDKNRTVLLDATGFLGNHSIQKYEQTIQSLISPKKSFWKFWD